MLQFTGNGTFQLTVFSDLHFAESDEADANSTRVMRNVLTQENPQLVVLDGDLISGEATNRSKSSAYIDHVVAPLVELGFPWASTYGNHDCDINLDPARTVDLETRYPNCLTQQMVVDPNAGVTNYYLPVFSHGAAHDSTPVLLLWFFDSRGGRVPMSQGDTSQPVSRPNWVDDSVIEWFEQTRNHLQSQYHRSIPSVTFFHIPVDAMREFQKSGVDPATEPGINGEPVSQQGLDGGFDYSGQDVRFMKALIDTEGLLGTFSGHDHDNDWCCPWTDALSVWNLTGNGIDMCYTRHSGYGGYGDWARGGRQIVLDEQHLKSDMHTWVRLENGTISGDVHLNATYGDDVYLARGAEASLAAVLLPEYRLIIAIWAAFFIWWLRI